jgi:hypothetical protein
VVKQRRRAHDGTFEGEGEGEAEVGVGVSRSIETAREGREEWKTVALREASNKKA